jgi:hypothetical protein
VFYYRPDADNAAGVYFHLVPLTFFARFHSAIEAGRGGFRGRPRLSSLFMKILYNERKFMI